MKKKRFVQKLTAVFLAAVILLFCAPVTQLAGLDIGLTKASAISTTKSGTFAKTLKWSFNTLTKKLTISGKGAIPDFEYDSTDYNYVAQTPWKKYNPISLEIKSGVTKIGENAFSDCTLLNSVTIADSVEYISGGNFDASIWMHKQTSKNKGIVYIGKNLYSYSASNTNVTVKNSTVSISPSAFAFNEKLQSVTLPSSLKTIGYGAFDGCEKLKSIKIPKSVTTIEDCAFEDCTALSSVSLSEGLKTIGYGVFTGCEKLKTITIPSTVSKIDFAPFAYCYSLSKISVSEKNKYYCSDKYGVLYNKKKTDLIQFPAANKATSYSVSSTVTKITDSAFSGAENLKKITLPSKLKEIGCYAFSECSALTTINFPKTVETANYTNIEDTNWYAVQPIGLIYIGQVAIGYKGNIPKNAKLSIKKGTTSIADGAFFNISNYDNLSSVTLPSGLKSIGEYSFACCTNLKSINFPSTINKIGKGAFMACGLTSVVIPAKVTKIELSTFSGCENLKSIKILNPLCVIPAPEKTGDSEISVFISSNAIPKNAKIISFKGSSAESYTKKNGNTFEALDPINLKNCTVSKIATQKYTGKALSPAVKITYQGAALKSGKHFTVTYSSNTKIGTAKVTIKGNSKYGFTGTVTTTFKIAK
ncbi:MAG: leucine-rich repeat domain-containing protein [Acutalibacteraceae bacterium]